MPALPLSAVQDAQTKAGSAAAAGARPDIAALAASSGGLLQCGSLNPGGWSTTSPTFQTIGSCTLTVPENGVVYLSASASIGLNDSAYEAAFNLSIDDPSGNDATDRRVDVYPDTGDGTDKSVADSLLAPLSAGTHTFFFLGARSGGTGTVQLYRPSLAVLYFPASNAEVRTCGASGDTTWTTSSPAFQTIRSCTFSAPTKGFVFMSGTGSVGLGSDGAYEAHFRLGIDSASGTDSSDRWVNVYPDNGNGTDETVDASLLLPVEPGNHDVSFVGARHSGTGTVQLSDPTLSVLFFPLPSATAKTCGVAGPNGYPTDSADFVAFRACSLYIPQDGYVFVDAGASAALAAGGSAWEGQFRVVVDNAIGSTSFDRWVNVYPDNNNGTDRALAISGLINVTRGLHTFYLIGKRFGGTGTMVLFSPSITVIAPAVAPSIRRIPNQTVPENLPTETIPFTFTTWLGPDATTLTGRAANRALVPDANIAIGGSGENRTVTITPTHDLAGITPITITATDGVVTATQTFTLTVVAPRISPIPNQIVLRNQTPAPIPFTIVSGDDPYRVTLTASSSNPALVPNAGITLGGAGPNRTIRIAPRANVFGRTTITLVLQDAASTASTTFTVTVTDYRIAFIPSATR